MYRIALLAVQNCMYSSVIGLKDIFTVASIEAQRLFGGKEVLFDPYIVGSERRPVTGFNSTRISADIFFKRGDFFDIVYVPVIFGEISTILDEGQTIDWLAEQGAKGACLCSACAGAFLIAQTGLLAGKRATTHWNLAGEFARRFPDVILKREKMLVDEGDIVTAGGVTAYLDLALHLVGRFGSPQLAASLSRLLLIDPARYLQSPYRQYSYTKGHGDERVVEVQKWLEEDCTRPVSLKDLADRARLGERTLMRRFKKATGDTPLKYLQQLRIDKARMLLESTSETIESITMAIGYEDVSSFRKLFTRLTGLSPAEYRRRFTILI